MAHRIRGGMETGDRRWCGCCRLEFDGVESGEFFHEQLDRGVQGVGGYPFPEEAELLWAIILDQ